MYVSYFLHSTNDGYRMNFVKVHTIWMLFLVVGHISAQEYTIFDESKRPIAYLFMDKNEKFIYEFSGEPLAVLEHYEDEDYAIFGINGMQIGWFSEGWLYDLQGSVVGFLEGAMKVKNKKIPSKQERKAFRFQGYKEPVRLKYPLKHVWSKMSLKHLFREGLKPSPYPEHWKPLQREKPKVHKI